MLEALGNLGDFIGGIAVVITLLYLAIQVRQNTSALKSASWQEVVAGARQSARLRGDAAIAPAWARGLSRYPDMPAEEMAKFNTAITDEALHFQGVFALHQAGQLDQSVYQAYRNWFSCIIATPGGAVWWDTIAKPIFVPEMVAAIDQYLASTEVADILAFPGNRPEDWPATG